MLDCGLEKTETFLVCPPHSEGQGREQLETQGGDDYFDGLIGRLVVFGRSCFL